MISQRKFAKKLMRLFAIFFYVNYQVKDEMGKTCSTHGEKMNTRKVFGGKAMTKENTRKI
jgi:hypothetical protein